jgi:hypothetical protein
VNRGPRLGRAGGHVRPRGGRGQRGGR